MKYKAQVSVEHFFSKTNITSDFNRKIEIKLSIQCLLSSGHRLMAHIQISLMIYLMSDAPQKWRNNDSALLCDGRLLRVCKIIKISREDFYDTEQLNFRDNRVLKWTWRL